MDVFKQGVIEMLCDTIELRSVMHSKFSGCSCPVQVFVECMAEIFASSVRAQDFDGLAVLLGRCPCFERFVRGEGLVLGVHEVYDSVPSCIIGKCDEVTSSLTRDGLGWPPYIGMYLISEVLSRRTDPDFRDWVMGGTSKNAYVTFRVIEGYVCVQFYACDSTTGD